MANTATQQLKIAGRLCYAEMLGNFKYLRLRSKQDLPAENALDAGS